MLNFKRILILSVLAFYISCTNGQSPNWAWAKRIQTNLNNMDHASLFPNRIVCDNAGNIYVARAFNGTTSIDGIVLTSRGLSDVFVAKYDPMGNIQWAISAGGLSRDGAAGVALDNNGNLAVAGFYTDTATFGTFTLKNLERNLFIAIYNTDNGVCERVSKIGSLLNTALSSSFNMLRQIFIDNTGSYYIDGVVTQVALGNQPWTGRFVAKYDSAFNFIWVTGVNVGIAENLYTNETFINGQGICYNGGSFQGSTSSQNEVIHADSSTSNGYLAKYGGALGEISWLNKVGGQLVANTTLSGNCNNSIYVAGYYKDSCTFDNGTRFTHGQSNYGNFLLKKDADGHVLWVKDLLFSQLSNTSITVTDNTNGDVIVMGGNAAANIDSSYQFAAKFDTDGNEIWSRMDYARNRFGKITSTMDPAGNLIICGTQTGGLICNLDTFPNEINISAIFIAKLGNNTINSVIERRDESITANIFPNPNNGTFTISYQLAPPQKNCTLQITDISGKTINSYPINPQQRSVEIQEHLPPSSYFANIIMDNKIAKTLRFVVVK